MSGKKRFSAFALALFLSSSIAQAASAPLANVMSQTSATIRFEPTRPGFATSHTPVPLRPITSGDLSCTTPALADCVVRNMPLLSQVDASLLKPLTKYASRYVVKTGSNAGMVIWAEPQFGTAPTPYTPSAFAQNILNNGCYITSLTTLEHAALLDRNGTRVSGRAVTFGAVKANRFINAPDALNQLEWQYRRWADKLRPNTANPTQPSSPDFLELPEFASDVSGLATRQINNPSRMRNDGIIAGMKRGATYIIEFSRYTVKAGPPNGRGVRTLALTVASWHKVAISGFQTGTYPLLINDVGNGERYRVRVTSDVRSIHFYRATPHGKVAIPPSNLTLSGQPYPKPLFLIYEGADSIGVNNGDEIFVITTFDALSVSGAHVPPHV